MDQGLEQISEIEVWEKRRMNDVLPRRMKYERESKRMWKRRKKEKEECEKEMRRR